MVPQVWHLLVVLRASDLMVSCWAPQGRLCPTVSLFFFDWFTVLHALIAVWFMWVSSSVCQCMCVCMWVLVPPGLTRFARPMSRDKRAPSGFTTEPLLPSPSLCVDVALVPRFYFHSTSTLLQFQTSLWTYVHSNIITFHVACTLKASLAKMNQVGTSGFIIQLTFCCDDSTVA